MSSRGGPSSRKSRSRSASTSDDFESSASSRSINDRCQVTETGRCFTDELGQVESVELDVVTARHNDGRDTMDVTLAADSTPSPGERVRIERWDGEVVSLNVPGRERRYHTLDWPRRWDPYVLWVGILGALCLLPAVVAGIRALSQRLSR